MQRTGESGGEMAGVETVKKKDQREGDKKDGGRGRWGSPGGHTMCESTGEGELLCLSGKLGL